MDYFVPLFVAVPLAGAFITAIAGNLVRGFGKIFTSVVVAFITGLSVYFIFFVEGTVVYQVGGWKALEGIPVAIYMVLDGLSVYM
ncbi:MAG: hypothetical protein ACOC7U_02980, partial [Spirochaetota bacterium]